MCIYCSCSQTLAQRFLHCSHKVKVPKLATAHKQRCIYASTNGSITCSYSIYVLSDGIQVHLLGPKTSYKIQADTLNQTAYHLSD